MTWLGIVALCVYGITAMYGLGWGVANTDELMGSSPGCMTTLYTWLCCAAAGPLIVVCVLIKCLYNWLVGSTSRSSPG